MTMKGHGGWFVLVSIIGIFLGIWLAWHGANGNGLGSLAILVIGIFITIKEILDMVHG
jgi:hypothetical protein